MIYGYSTKATDWPQRSFSDWLDRLMRLLLFFIPRANPEIDPLLPQVKKWALELSDDGWPQREIGLGAHGEALFAIPDENNSGFWTDMAHRQFSPTELTPATQEEFEELWASASKVGV